MKSREACCFFLGATIGAAAAILTAPKAGTETVADLKRKAGKGVDSLKHQFDSCGVQLKGTLKDTVERGRQAMRQQKEHLAAAVEAGRRAYRDASTPAQSLH